MLKKKRYKTYQFWGFLVALAGVIVPVYLFVISKPNDFVINSIPSVLEIEKGGKIQSTVVIESEKYDGQIRLTTKSQNDHIDISFKPSFGVASPNFESIVTVNVSSSMKVGEQEIEIVGIGSKNNIERSTSLLLKVKNPPFDPLNLVELFYPDGFMGDIESISLDYYSTDDPFIGEKCIEILYSGNGTNNWAGIYWLYPNDNWGVYPKGRNLNGAKKLSFMAKGASGGEKAEFKIGGVSGKYSGSLKSTLSISVTLNSNWKKYSLNLEGKDLSNIMGGFCWVTNNSQNPKGCTIYIDNIVFE